MTTPFTHDSRHLAETYERVSDLQFEGGRRLVERVGLEEGAHVLDIGGGEERMLSLRDTQLVAPMVKAIQEQQTVIEEQKDEIKILKERLARLEALLNVK